MVKRRFYAGIFSLLCIMAFGFGQAQADEAFSVAGSALANVLIENLAEAAGIDSLSIQSNGSAGGIDAFCAGETDLATASREMTSAERAICDAYETAFSEILIGHHIVAIIAHSDAPAQCLPLDTVEAALRPTASNVVSDWSFYREENAELPLSAVLPETDALAYVIVDSVVAGDGLRLDSQHFEAAAEAIDIVADTAGALAVVPWTNQAGNYESVQLLEISGDLGGCSLPSAENVEGEDYPLALSLYVYVNRAALDSNDILSEFMQFSIGEASAGVIEAAGAIPPSGATAELNARVLADADAGPGVSGDAGDFRIPADLSGEIQIVGSATAHQALQRAGSGLGEQLNINFAYAGISAGIGRLCAGEADIAALDDAVEADMLADCATNGVATIPLELGAQAAVLVSNAADDFAACLTTDQVNTIWRAESESIVERWADAADAFPDQQLTLFGLSSLDIHTDILLQGAGKTIPPIRRDTEQDFDPLYRAAAVGNVRGGLTYMAWNDYQRALENAQANIQLVAVDAGSGCVEPNASTIKDGIYPLSRRASLLVSEASLADINIQALLWSLVDEGNWTAQQRDGFLSAETLELPIIRRELLRRFADAESRYAPAEASAESAGEDEADDDGQDSSAG